MKLGNLKKTCILVHGDWHAGWCWNNVATKIKGYSQILAPDLPGHGNNLAAFKYHLSQAVQKYNDYRPHFSLKGHTPFQYASQILQADLQSHIL